jgi:hypothetical protein
MDARAFASPKRLRPRRRVKPAYDGFTYSFGIQIALVRLIPSFRDACEVRAPD